MLLNPALWAFSQVKVLIWLLVLVRMTGLLATMPGFGQTRIPLLIRVALVVLMALVLAPVVPPPGAAARRDLRAHRRHPHRARGRDDHGPLRGPASIDIVAFAGQLMDTQMGFAFVQFLDPVSAHPVSVSGSLLTQLTMLFILVSGLHHQMIMALVESYRILPIGQGLPLKPLALVAQMGLIMLRGFQLAFPVMLTLFLIDVMEGISGKFMPQLQLIQLSFPIKIAVGLTVLGFVLRELPAWLLPLLEDAPRTALRFLS